MMRLYTLATMEPKVLKTFPEGTHNDSVAAPGYFSAIDDFFQEYVVD